MNTCTASATDARFDQQLRAWAHATIARAPPRARLERLARARNGRSHVWLRVLRVPETSLECDCHGRRPDGPDRRCARFRFHSPHAVRAVRNQPASKQVLARLDKAMASMGTRAAYRTASSQRVQDVIVTQTAVTRNSCTPRRDQNHHHDLSKPN